MKYVNKLKLLTFLEWCITWIITIIIGMIVTIAVVFSLLCDIPQSICNTIKKKLE